jgi:[ribosomal protein S18]-alanine N-acetyltransferase
MIRSDMPWLLQIEDESFEFPWSESDFLACLRQRNCVGMVAQSGNKILGFMIYDLYQDRMQLLSLAIPRLYRRHSIGSQLIAKLIEKLSQQRRTTITTEVRETNLPAQLFFKSMGFRATGVLRNYYEDTAEDAIAFAYELPSPELAKRG